MLTNALFYREPYRREFSAVVTGCQPVPEGWAITLSDTAFYPEGGGQPCDLGTLNDAEVLDVRECDGQILHLCREPFIPGTSVTGKIQWDRRFDLMQQHSGEHMVSGIIHRRYGYHNVGFHMGSELMTIDFDGRIPPEDLPEIEMAVNRRIWENLPVKCWFPPEDALSGISYRSKKALAWPVRIVEIPDTDICACCGTHVAYTGEIGLVKLISCIRFHQGVRIEMACGERAFRYLSDVFVQNRLVSQTFSARPLETAQAAQAAGNQIGELKFRLAGLQRELYHHLGAGFSGEKMALRYDPALEPGQLRELCEILLQYCPLAVAITGTGSDLRLCLGGDASVVARLSAGLKDRFGARGGGKPGFFQGSLLADPREVENFLRQIP